MKTEHFKKIDIKTRQLVNTLFLWNYKAAFKGRWIEFDDFREYTFSDDARYIDWLVSAREWKTVIRRYREERELEILFVLDNSLSMQFGDNKSKRETLEEVFYILGFSALQNGDKIGACILDGQHSIYIPFKKWKWALFQVFQKLESETPVIAPEKFSFDFLNKTRIKNTLTFVLTDKLEIDDASLKIARLKNDIIFIHISDYFENTLEWKGIKVLQNGTQQISINLDDREKKEKYRELRQEKMQKFQKKLLKYKIDSIMIDDRKNPYKEILKLMKKREI